MSADNGPIGIERSITENGYDHQYWERKRNFLRTLLRMIGLPWLARYQEISGLDTLPDEGPAIIYFNHISFLDPFAVANPLPRHVVAMAKVEVYDYPIIKFVPNLWGVIPVRREELDRQALRQAMAVLDAGEWLLLAPEGTRNESLQDTKEGLAYLATRKNTILIPGAVSGTPNFPALIGTKRWRENGICVRYGRPFRLRAKPDVPQRERLRQMTDEAMYQLAKLLPEKLRGVYSNLDQATEEMIEWL